MDSDSGRFDLFIYSQQKISFICSFEGVLRNHDFHLECKESIPVSTSIQLSTIQASFTFKNIKLPQETKVVG
jgi:hypothetical protein